MNLTDSILIGMIANDLAPISQQFGMVTSSSH
jgi:hypothetical protein